MYCLWVAKPCNKNIGNLYLTLFFRGTKGEKVMALFYFVGYIDEDASWKCMVEM